MQAHFYLTTISNLKTRKLFANCQIAIFYKRDIYGLALGLEPARTFRRSPCWSTRIRCQLVKSLFKKMRFFPFLIDDFGLFRVLKGQREHRACGLQGNKKILALTIVVYEIIEREGAKWRFFHVFFIKKLALCFKFKAIL